MPLIPTKRDIRTTSNGISKSEEETSMKELIIDERISSMSLIQQNQFLTNSRCLTTP